jgi:class 3 adenylate cyclase
MDPEDLREVISAYQKCVAETVQRFGGFVAKYMGDGVLIYFVTLTPRGAETPVRFVATLGPGQAVTLSTPRKLGEPADRGKLQTPRRGVVRRCPPNR